MVILAYTKTQNNSKDSMKILLIINEAPTANEKIYNAFRTAKQLQKDNELAEIGIYLLADGAFCALPNETMPAGIYNISQMMIEVIKKGAKVKMCTSCGEARGLKEMKLIDGVQWASLKDLTEWIVESDKVLTY
jgi:uncharacterized protein involved in oxidation of intracellular sulfur